MRRISIGLRGGRGTPWRSTAAASRVPAARRRAARTRCDRRRESLVLQLDRNLDRWRGAAREGDRGRRPGSPARPTACAAARPRSARVARRSTIASRAAIPAARADPLDGRQRRASVPDSSRDRDTRCEPTRSRARAPSPEARLREETRARPRAPRRSSTASLPPARAIVGRPPPPPPTSGEHLADHGGRVDALVDRLGRGRRDRCAGPGVSRRARPTDGPSAPRSRSASSSSSSAGVSPCVGGQHARRRRTRRRCATERRPGRRRRWPRRRRPSTLQLADAARAASRPPATRSGSVLAGRAPARPAARSRRAEASARDRPVTASMRRTPCPTELSDRILNGPTSPVDAHVRAAAELASSSPSISTTRTMSPYFSPNSMVAPSRRASSCVVSNTRTGRSSPITRLISSSTSASSLGRHRRGVREVEAKLVRVARPIRAGARDRRAGRAGRGEGDACPCGSRRWRRGSTTRPRRARVSPATSAPRSTRDGDHLVAVVPMHLVHGGAAALPLDRAVVRDLAAALGVERRGAQLDEQATPSPRSSTASGDRLDVERPCTRRTRCAKPASRANAASRSGSAAPVRRGRRAGAADAARPSARRSRPRRGRGPPRAAISAVTSTGKP